MENTTSGEKAEAQNVKRSTAGASPNSAPSGKRSTSKTKKLTLGEALEILSQSFSIVEDAGGDLDVEETGDDVKVTIHRSRFTGGMIVPIQSADISAQ